MGRGFAIRAEPGLDPHGLGGIFMPTALMLGRTGRGCQAWSRVLDVEQLLQWGLPGTMPIRGGAPWGGASLGAEHQGLFKGAGPTSFT